MQEKLHNFCTPLLRCCHERSAAALVDALGSVRVSASKRRATATELHPKKLAGDFLRKRKNRTAAEKSSNESRDFFSGYSIFCKNKVTI